ncbi:hypothetical protein CVCC1112_3099 [Paenarthrobacter nicotinovorans]|nr:hypothetical protein CVCC1112_3099 [Paenarthrobacter nicotinovorans]
MDAGAGASVVEARPDVNGPLESAALSLGLLAASLAVGQRRNVGSPVRNVPELRYG